MVSLGITTMALGRTGRRTAQESAFAQAFLTGLSQAEIVGSSSIDSTRDEVHGDLEDQSAEPRWCVGRESKEEREWPDKGLDPKATASRGRL